MDFTRRAGPAWAEGDDTLARNRRNTGSSDLDGDGVAYSRPPGGPRKYPLPKLGDCYGELTVVGFTYGARGGVVETIVRCSCGREPHLVFGYNLRKGVSTRCNACAKLAAGCTHKHYCGYADVVPDDTHRRRLLNRICAATQRCENPKSKQYHHYGGRGIRVFPDWRTGMAGRKAWLAHLVTLPGWEEPRFDMDRIDNNQGYEPGNLRFVSRSDNCQNRRRITDMQLRITELEAENACLRHRELRSA